MKAVEKGRERLRGRLVSDELSTGEFEEIAPQQQGGTQLYDYERG
jgi:hypothetical protein